MSYYYYYVDDIVMISYIKKKLGTNFTSKDKIINKIYNMIIFDLKQPLKYIEKTS